MKAKTRKGKPMHPMFKKYSLEKLSEKLDRSEEYLLGLKLGRRPCGDKFRHLATTALRRPEEALFNEEITNGTG